jgi:hypothetical protein
MAGECSRGGRLNMGINNVGTRSRLIEADSVMAEVDVMAAGIGSVDLVGYSISGRVSAVKAGKAMGLRTGRRPGLDAGYVCAFNTGSRTRVLYAL